MRAIDTFCGAGGLSLGLKSAGFKVVYAFDNDDRSIQTYSSNPRHGETLVECRDIRSVLRDGLPHSLSDVNNPVDLVAGGPPCQGFSVQRTVGGDDDERNILVHDFGDLILEVQPRFLLMENVVGIGGKRGREVLWAFIERMEQSGYVISTKTLDAQDFGVPQRRRRVFVIGHRINAPWTFNWPESAHAPRASVRDAISRFPSPPRDGSEHPRIPNHRADKLSNVNLERIRSILPGQGREDLPDRLLATCHRRSADEVGHRGVYGRMSWDEVAPTITARFDSFTRGKFGHPSEDRSISLREGAALQSFPDDYIFLGTKVEVARQIGNAVPPLLAHAVAEAIASEIQAEERIEILP